MKNKKDKQTDVRDIEEEICQYSPDNGRTFKATNSDAEFIADGENWHMLRTDDQVTHKPFRTRQRLMGYEAGFTKPVFHWTFDGGLSNSYEHREIFNKLDLTPTLAVSPGRMDSDDTMSWQQLRELQNKYEWGVSNHGHNHKRFDEIGPEKQTNEIAEAITAFQRHGVKHSHYMYPWGMAGGKVGRSVVSEYYPFAWGTIHAPDTSGIVDVSSPYRLPRTLVEKTDRDEITAAIDRAINNSTGMVLFGHNIVDDKSVDDQGFETDIDFIGEITEYVRENGGEWVNDIEDVIRYSKTPVRIGAGSEPVRIDKISTGRLTADSIVPLEPEARVFVSRTQTVPPQESTKLQLQETEYIDTLQFDETRNAVQISQAGTYSVMVNVHIDPTSSDGTFEIKLLRDGQIDARSTVAISGSEQVISGELHSHSQVDSPVTLHVELEHCSTGSIRTVAGNENSFFSISRIA